MTRTTPAVLCLCLLWSGLSAGITLFDKGKSDAVIVVDDDAAPNAKYAARELHDYLQKIGNVDVPVRNTPGNKLNIFIGEGKGTQKEGLSTKGLSYDGFRIETHGNNLYIFGRDRKLKEPLVGYRNPFEKIHIYNKKLDISAFGEAGTLYGVYHLLREYAHCRWYMPGELGEVIPKQDTLTLPDLKVEKSPDFYYRTAYWGLFNNNPEATIWYRRAGFGAPFPVEINHSFFYMNKYQKDHPEWFAMIDGKRDFNISCERQGNLCLSQKGLLDAFVADARKYFDTHPECMIFPVMPNDWFNRICDCPECQKQAEYSKPDNAKFSNYVWSFVNKVAKEVGKTHPDKLIACCAYNSYQAVPDKVTFEPNVAVMFTKAVHYRFDDAYRMRNDVLAFQWAKITKNFFIWEYYCWDMTNSHLTGLPIFFSKWLEKDLRGLKGISKGEFIDGGSVSQFGYKFYNPELNAINYYFTGRLLWDASLNVSDLLDDYCTNFYGPAAPEMKKYWTRAEEIWTDMKVKKRGAADNLNETLYTPQVLLELKGYLERAQKLVNPDSVYAKRIAGIQKLFYPYVDKVNNTRSQIPSVKIKRTAVRPVIDGKREELWRSANVVDFVRQTDARKPLADTFVRMLHDDENIYLFINCFEPNMKGIVAKATQKDSLAHPYIWDDDAIELFISPDAAVPGRTVQVMINSLGTVVDGCHGSAEFKHPLEFKYDSKVECKAGKDKNGWTLEIAVPKKSLVLDGNPPAKIWRMNICRDRNVSNIDTKEMERSSWSPPLSLQWNVPGRFGNVTLE